MKRFLLLALDRLFFESEDMRLGYRDIQNVCAKIFVVTGAVFWKISADSVRDRESRATVCVSVAPELPHSETPHPQGVQTLRRHLEIAPGAWGMPGPRPDL